MTTFRTIALVLVATLLAGYALFQAVDPGLWGLVAWLLRVRDWVAAPPLEFAAWLLRVRDWVAALPLEFAAWRLRVQETMMSVFSWWHALYAGLSLVSAVIVSYSLKYQVIVMNPDIGDGIQVLAREIAVSWSALRQMCAGISITGSVTWALRLIKHLCLLVVQIVLVGFLFVAGLVAGHFVTDSHRQAIHMFFNEASVSVTSAKVAEDFQFYCLQQQNPETGNTRMTQEQYTAAHNGVWLQKHADAVVKYTREVKEHRAANGSAAPLVVSNDFDAYMRHPDTVNQLKRDFEEFTRQHKDECHDLPCMSFDKYIRFVNVTPVGDLGMPAIIDRDDAAMFPGGKVHKRLKFVENYPGVVDPAAPAAPAAAGGGAGGVAGA